MQYLLNSLPQRPSEVLWDTIKTVVQQKFQAQGFTNLKRGLIILTWFGKLLKMVVNEWSLYKKGCSMVRILQYNIGVSSEMFMNVVLP